MSEKYLVSEKEARTLYNSLIEDLPDGQSFDEFMDEFEGFCLTTEEECLCTK